MILLTIVKKFFHFLPIIPFNFPFAQCISSFPDLHVSFNFYKPFSTFPFLASFSLFLFSFFFLLNFPPFFHPAVHRRVPSSELRFRYFINCLFSFRCLRTFVLSHLPIFFFSSSSILSAISPNIFTFTVTHISFCHYILHIIYVTSSRPLFISPFLSFPVFFFFFFLQMPPLHLSVLSYIHLSFSISHRPSHFCVKYITYLRSRTSPRANAGIISMQIHDRAHPRLNLISVNPIREGS